MTYGRKAFINYTPRQSHVFFADLKILEAFYGAIEFLSPYLNPPMRDAFFSDIIWSECG